MQYQIIRVTTNYLADAFDELMKDVNSFIKAGWKPIGGISVTKKYEQITPAAPRLNQEPSYATIYTVAQPMVNDKL